MYDPSGSQDVKGYTIMHMYQHHSNILESIARGSEHSYWSYGLEVFEMTPPEVKLYISSSHLAILGS